MRTRVCAALALLILLAARHSFSQDSPITGAGQITVHVRGGVYHEGVVILPKDSKIIDAIAAAGGVYVGMKLQHVYLWRTIDGNRQKARVRVRDEAGAEVPAPTLLDRDTVEIPLISHKE